MFIDIFWLVVIIIFAPVIPYLFIAAIMLPLVAIQYALWIALALVYYSICHPIGTIIAWAWLAMFTDYGWPVTGIAALLLFCQQKGYITCDV